MVSTRRVYHSGHRDTEQQDSIVSQGRWIEITPSEHPWEREALAFLRERLPDQEPYRAWTNFEFIAGDGSINEVDALILTPKGFFLIEIKSRPGHVNGDASTWTWSADGRRFTDDNPLLLANRKAKKLADLLRGTRALKQQPAPFLEARVFLSADDNRVRLPEHVARLVHTRDRAGAGERNSGRGIVDALTRWPDDQPPRRRVDRRIANALTRAMEEVGVRPSQRARQVGDYRLERLLFEGPAYQDWCATHVALDKDKARVRIYVVEPGASAEARASIVRAAKREYAILHGIAHPGILRARAYTEHERGPALIYEYVENARRLDHYLAEHGERLSVGQRIELLREIAEAVRYAHGKRLYHRALSPQNILVLDADSPAPRVQLLNWQTAAREPAATRGTGFGISATSHIANFVAEESAVYMAPEALAERGEAGEQADVFSLGAIAYHLFAGVPPATSFYELCEKLREGKGLRIAAALDGASERLDSLIQFSTYPEVTGRLDTVADFLDELTRFEDEITTPDPKEGRVHDPSQAKPKDILSDGLVVKRRLGKGASSVALLVDNGGKEQVLKVALEPDDNARLAAEARALSQLRRHPFIVQLHEQRDYQGRSGLLMEKAGDRTLQQRLAQDGPLQLELLQRLGEDLLQIVDWLEQEGIPHRDIKPANLGVALMGKTEQLHLVLFDFSLAETPAENIRAGTVPYLDPFLALRRPPRWDFHAERFAASVTLYQMATGSEPIWGDGQSDPAVLDAEATLDADAFDAALREPMAAFFRKALRRDYAARFDNAPDMLAAWRAVFSGAERAEVATEHGEGTAPVTPLERATLDTLLTELGLTPRALNALERAGLHSVRDLLHYPMARIRRLRGVGTKTRRELAECMEALAERFPEAAAEPKQVPPDEAEAPAQPDETPRIDALAALLVPAGRGTDAEQNARAVAHLLRLAAAAADAWPSQSTVARELAVNPATVSNALAGARRRWLKTGAITGLRDEIVALLDARGGVMTAAELCEALLASRGSEQAEPLRSRQARAVLRAAVETERDRAGPRWILRRADQPTGLLLARDAPADDAGGAIDGERLADYAEALGRRADALAAEDPLRPPGRALEALQAVVPVPGVAPLPASRLLQLAAGASRTAAVSTRLELYPRGMPAPRALKLALRALSGVRQLTPAQVRERIAARYPEAEPLPPRPALDELLRAAGSELRWQPAPPAAAGHQAAPAAAAPEAGVYVAPLRDFTTVLSSTRFTSPTAVARHFDAVPADQVTLDQLDRRLRHSIEHGQFLALTVSPARCLAAERTLAARFALDVLSLDRLLIRHMQAFAADKQVDWRMVLAADAVPAAERAESRDWANLQRVVRAALPGVSAALAAAPRHVLLTNPGLLARYDQLALLGALCEQTGRPGGPPGLWVLIPTDGQSTKPMLDGRPVPVFTTAQWARLPDLWLAAAA
ncbi:BREX system serine/threonine kinase PglW [Thiohalocapsa sp. ML1]|uniref:BREX system serine/threonine kinase PglW n=1 Tax=Thiohalocapsa sp. ML1 TaxID=1431688 RepID=UPI0007320EB4|nr:BREX system serine/threonine kinase PglW [Thiohalocapsa sp. ML1]